MLMSRRVVCPLKIVTVVDDDVNIYDASDVEWAMAQRWRPDSGDFDQPAPSPSPQSHADWPTPGAP